MGIRWTRSIEENNEPPRDGRWELTMTIATLPPDDANTWSIDFESTYSKTNSLKVKPTWAYVYDPETEIYLLSVAGPDNFVWVGRPQDFDWAMLEGKIVLAHNMGFDGLVLRRLEEEGVIPKINYAELHCTADMAAYFKLPRALKDIAQFVFKMPDVAKKGREVRDRMKGLPVERMMDDPEIRTYAANDAILCRKLWMEWSENWPEIERKVSRIAREGGWRGVKIDMDYVDDCVARLHERMFAAAKSIPWEWDPKKTPLARKKMIEQAQQEVVEWRELEPEEFQAINQLDPSDSESVTVALNELWFGEDPKRVFPCRIDIDEETGCWMLTKFMWYPSSFAKDDEDCEEWEDEYGDTYGWIGAVRDWRRYNMLLQKFQHLQKFTSADGKYRVQLKYFGGHTGRWSGAGFFNVQNLPKYEMFCLLDENKKPIKGTGFDLRRCLKGPFYVTDYNQVEARGLLALVKDERILPKLREGMSVYQAHAETTMGRTWEDLKTEDVPLYQQKKMEVLLLGFGGGAAKLARAAYLMTKDDPRPEAVIRWTEAEAQVVVDGFRNHTRDYICRLWSKLQRMAEKAASARKELMIIRLPSGRPMYYWNVRKRTVKAIRKTDEGDKLVERTEIFTQNAKGDPSSYRKLYGGLLTENCVAGGTLVLTDKGWKPIENIELTDLVHDGISFVQHGGLVNKSVQPCVMVDGVWMTPDHEVLTDEGWKAALEKPRPYRPNLRGADCGSACWERRKENEVGVSLHLRESGREDRARRNSGSAEGQDAELRLPPWPAYTSAYNDTRDEQTPGVLGVAVDAGPVPAPHPPVLGALWWARNNGLRALGGVVRKLLGGHGTFVRTRSGVGPQKQQRRVQQRELSVGQPYGKLPQHPQESYPGMGDRPRRRQRAVEIDVDLPCGAWMGHGEGVHCSPGFDERGEGARTGRPGVGAAEGPGAWHQAVDVLPSLPERVARRESVLGAPGNEQQVFDVVDCGPRHRFVVKGSAGPFIVHNCVQAMCRDVLRDGWVALHEAGYDVAFTAHDEYVVELKPGQTGEDVDKLLLETGNNSWAAFIPLGLDGHLVDFYTK